LWLAITVATIFAKYNASKINCVKGTSSNSGFHLTVLNNRHSLWEEKWTPVCWRSSNID